ncbi:MAG TPA: response regulator [Roseiflexaceae bacterium]
MSEVNTILIVDDEPLVRETLAALLRTQCARLTFACDGLAALAQAAAEPPDLILLDVIMPRMDGFEVCRRLRSDPLLAEVPIMLVTALDDRASRLEGIEAGADDFVSKPFDRIELRARINTMTRLNRYRRLLEERGKFARVVELAPDGMLIVDQDGLVVLANPAVARMLDASHQGELIGTQFVALVAPEQRDTCRAALQQARDDPAATVRIEASLARTNGARLPIELHIGSFSWDGRPAAQIIARDITERKRADLLEEERHLTAYELHDGLAQIVTGVHQHMQAFAAHYRPRSAQRRRELDHVLHLARASVQEVRRVIAGLRPTALDDFGLAAALQMQAAALRAEGLATTFEETLGDERLPQALETVLFRVAQEALTNARRHARTDRILVTLARKEHTIRLTIQDWGCGFDPAELLGRARPGERIGLRGMRERVALLGGRCDIESSHGAGTLVVAEVPLPTEHTHAIVSANAANRV